MLILGRGRIVIWEGASLWVLSGGGEPAELDPHAHHAIQITFQLEGRFEIGIGGTVLTGPVAAIGPDVPHTFRASGAHAFLFVAPESTAGRALADAVLAGRPAVAVAGGALMAALTDLRDIYRANASAAALLGVGRRIVDGLSVGSDAILPDPRILAMIDYARGHLDETVRLPDAAARVCLSESRARHLFVAATKLPFKTFVLWVRLERAVELYASGSSLTEAAHQAGFADSAHFSRTFKRTFGLPAAALRLHTG